MADKSPSQASPGQPVAVPASAPQPYAWLRWTIRITGILLMFAGTLYLGGVASALITDSEGDSLFVVVVSVVALGLGIFVLRTGINMLRSINTHTIGNFSFIFALIYSSILMQILPSVDFFSEYPIILCLMLFLYFGLSYWVLRFILSHLLLPREER